MSDTGEIPQDVPENITQPEKALEKPAEQPKPPDKLGIDSALTALDKTTPGIPDRPDLVNLANSNGKTSFQEMMNEGISKDDTQIVGGEIIAPTAVRNGPPIEEGLRIANEQGWLSAITRANGKEDASLEQRTSNIQEIVNSAKQAGIPTEKIKQHIEGLGLNVATPKSIESTSQPAQQQGVQEKPSRSTPPPEVKSIDGQMQNPYEYYGNLFPINTDKPTTTRDLQNVAINATDAKWFTESDSPTLAGEAIYSVYENLIKRTGELEPYKQGAKAEAQNDYGTYLEDLNKRRAESGKTQFGLDVKLRSDRDRSKDYFHTNDQANMGLAEFLYFFDKSKNNMQNPNAKDVRAYITLSPQNAQVQRDFVDLATQLYDAGIDFSAKAASPKGLRERTDNMVLYIKDYHQQKAGELINKFLTEKGIGQGHVLAAKPDRQDGLSWAQDPDQKQIQLWKEISGSSKDTSFNGLVATLAIPTYLERLAEAHDKKGSTTEAVTFKQEAVRVRSIISKYQQLATA